MSNTSKFTSDRYAIYIVHNCIPLVEKEYNYNLKVGKQNDDSLEMK